MTHLKNNSTQVNTWKENLLKTKLQKEENERRKLEKLNRMKESGELYDIMVSDAVFLITNKYNKDTNSSIGLHNELDGIVTLTVYGALLISTDLKLYSSHFSLPINPKTGLQCFYHSYQFENKEEVEKYLNDVKAQLPDDVKFRKRIETENFIFSGATVYDAQLEIDLNS